MRVPDLRLGPDDPLGECRRRREERPGDLFGGEPADLAKRERRLRVRGQGWVTAGEDEPEPIVFDALRVGPCRGVDDGDLCRGLLVERTESLPPAQAVDGL